MSNWLNIFTSKKKRKITHHARVFISIIDETAIVVTMHFNDEGGILYEDKVPVVLFPPIDPKQLGQTLLTALRHTTINALNENEKIKLTDWPAYKASKASSVRKFQQEYIYIHVFGANNSNMVYSIEGSPSKDSELNISSSISDYTLNNWVAEFCLSFGRVGIVNYSLVGFE